MPERIGELVVLGDRETVFGETEEEVETLPSTFRTTVPLTKPRSHSSSTTNPATRRSRPDSSTTSDLTLTPQSADEN